MPATWKTVRVFISSTFSDMHAERDHLVKVVFPSLREKLGKYRIHLVDIDLRWGVTREQADDDRALDLCLQQIDDCRPFFIGILGERYGYVPEKLPELEKAEYGSVQGMTGKSITDLEIVHGVLNDHQMQSRSFFYFRDQSFLDNVAAAKRGDMLSDSEESAGKLKKLKQAIRDVGVPVYEDYPCHFSGLKINWRLAGLKLKGEERQRLQQIAEDGIVDADAYAVLDDDMRKFIDDESVVYLDGLNEFGDSVFAQLGHAILNPDPDSDLAEHLREVQEPQDDPLGLAEEADYHDRFMESRLRIYVGREPIQNHLVEFADSDHTVPCLVTGPSGLGKSAAMAKFVTGYEQSHQDVLVIPHFIGASPASTGLRSMLHRFCSVLKREFAFEEEIPSDTNSLSGLFRQFITQVPDGRRVLFVLDALNQLDETDNAHALNWLPWKLPAHVKLIASCIDDPDRDEAVLEASRQRNHEELKIEPLTDEERLEIVHQVPSLSAKTLDPEQVGLLLENPATTNPLFLLVALEELRGFGSFEELNDRIKAFPQVGETVTTLFQQVLGRLENDFCKELLLTVLSLLESARRGLSEREFSALVGPVDRADDFFHVLRQLRPYLQYRGRVIDFFHRNLSKAARQRYLNTPEKRGKAHDQLADYFAAQPDYTQRTSHDGTHHPNERKADELPWQFAHANRHAELRKLLTQFDFLQAKVYAHGPQPLIEDYDLLNAGPHDSLGLIQGAITLASPVLAFAPAQLPCQLHGRLADDQSPVVLRLLDKTHADKYWLRPAFCSLTPPGGPLVRSLQAGDSRLGVATVALHCGKQQVFTASIDSTIKVWDLETGHLLRALTGHEDFVLSLAVDATGDRVVSASQDTTLIIWDLMTGQALQTLRGHTRRVNCVSLHSDGRRAVSGSGDETLKVWDIETGEMLRTFQGHTSEVSSVALHPDGRRAVSGAKNILIIWDLETGEILNTLHNQKSQILSVALHPDGRRAISGSWDNSIAVWDLERGVLLKGLNIHSGPVKSVAVFPDGRRAVSASRDSTLRVWYLETGEVVRTFKQVWLTSVVLHDDGRTAVSGSSTGSVAVWDLIAREALQSRDAHAGVVMGITMHGDGWRAVSASNDETLKLWDLKTGRVLRTIQGQRNSFRCVAVDSDRGRVVSGAQDMEVKVWSLETGNDLMTFRGHEGRVSSVAPHPDGKIVVSASWDKTVKVWDVSNANAWDEPEGYVHFVAGTRECLRTLSGHTDRVQDVAIHTDGRRVVSASWDKTLIVWDLETGEALQTFKGHTGEVMSVALHPDGRRAISASKDSTLKVWDLDSGEVLQTLEGHEYYVASVVLTDDGRRAISASEDKTLKVWDLETGQPIASFVAEGQLISCAVSPDGKTIAAGGAMGHLHILKLQDSSEPDSWNSSRNAVTGADSRQAGPTPDPNDESGHSNLAIASRIEDFRVIEFLHRNSVGSDYRVGDPATLQSTILRVFQTSQGTTSFIGFKPELNTLQRFEEYPNVAHLYASGEHEACSYLAIKLVDQLVGPVIRNLGERSPGRLPPGDVVQIVIAVAEALCVLHEGGIVHLDVRPSNIQVSEEQDWIRLYDSYGLACPLEEHDPHRVMGSLFYMSPEQVLAESATPQSDIYSLGATMYELLSGRKFRQSQGSNVAMMHYVINEQRHSFETSDLPSSLVPIFNKATAFEASQRFESADAMRQALLKVDMRKPEASPLGTTTARARFQHSYCHECGTSLPDEHSEEPCPTCGAVPDSEQMANLTWDCCRHCSGSSPPIGTHCIRCGEKWSE